MDTDNIAEPTQADVLQSEQSVQSQSVQSEQSVRSEQSVQSVQSVQSEQVTIPDMFTIKQVCEIISRYYDRAFKRLKFCPPAQIVDGGIAEFIDENVKATVATCRIRIRNILHINKQTGSMQLEVHLSDIMFQRGEVEFAVGAPTSHAFDMVD